jgi:hypothetical protein
MMMRVDPPRRLYQIKVTLIETDPPVWRRLLVRSDMSLLQLHRVLQIALGWTDSHLHEFRVGGVLFGESDPEADIRRISEKATFMADVLRHVDDHLIYEYDFGDSWEHDIHLEEVADLDPSVMYPIVVAWARACPPEDVGGTDGYESFLGAIADQNHPEHDEYLVWCGGSYNPDAFDIHSLNIALREISLQ